ncbi:MULTISPECIES: class I adenylate-forming enzyme family protein [unclassified Streptomyces]|uniref:class I adenylate-forming enzyme family protein n=1 Tax=unclassified Streptomyces TaxID=2593676 RepID=UPI00225AF66D|nr:MULTISPECIES: class I adenylate-forming enzyme family protein [unclassified Streptomyces]MCX5144158.1 acyl--CoA ligase [Streptomyces sp. NBC_00338]WRZ68533.1 acyl--CoA ligase [Streptomyces sp. NBC_01257]WSU62493.1 acyl--CoA ligase [Streptomyces sp. NBC_01104]
MTTLWPQGLPRTLDYPDGTIADLLAGSAHAYPDRAALVDGEERLTFAELHERALRVAQGLREQGIVPGEAVAVHMPNSIWFTVAYYGILLAGAAVVPVNPTQPPLALRRQLDDSGAVAAFTHPSVAARMAVALEGAGTVRRICVAPATTAAPAGDQAPAVFPVADFPFDDLMKAEAAPATVVDGDAVAHLAFTGGTTGVPKAVRVLHRNLLKNVLQVACWRSAAVPHADAEGRITLRHVEETRTSHHIPIGTATGISIAPLFHGMGMVGQSVFVAAGLTVVVFGRFDAVRYLDTIEQLGIHAITGSPALCHAVLAVPDVRERDLSCVRVVSTGSAPMNPAAAAELSEIFPNAVVSDGYGLTEATMGVAISPLDRSMPRPEGSTGLVLFDTEVEIREPDLVTPVPPGERGEVWVRGPQVTGGYLGHPELTAEQYVGGWLRTGDLGTLAPDGWLSLVGRAKDMLIYKGYNVYPGPLENVLREHPAVAQASVVGRPHPEHGEIPVAFVSLKAEAGVSVTAEELIAYVAERVAPYQRIRDVVIVDELPLSATGKILKTELRRRAADS